jgi:hypothetical protein
MKITILSNELKELHRRKLSRNNRGKNILVFLGSLLLVVMILSNIISCNDAIPKIENNFTAQHYGISVNLPEGWAAAEGPEMIMIQAYDGLIAFNSWGESDFWIYPDNISLSPDVITAAIPSGGAYIVLLESDGPPDEEGHTPDEYSRDDLSGLYTEHDWRQDEFPRIYYKEFYKAKTHLMLIIACKKDASDATVAQLNALLKSWRFVDFKVD